MNDIRIKYKELAKCIALFLILLECYKELEGRFIIASKFFGVVIRTGRWLLWAAFASS